MRERERERRFFVFIIFSERDCTDSGLMIVIVKIFRIKEDELGCWYCLRRLQQECTWLEVSGCLGVS